MTAPADTKPLVDISGLRHDIHRLLVLLLADERMSEVEAFSDLADDYHEREVNRLLIWIAIASRQLLVIDARTANRTCGRFYRRYPLDNWVNLNFRGACNTIIHAVEIIPYGIPEDEEDPPRRKFYDGTITIRGAKKRGGRFNTRAEMEVRQFAECCILLADGFLEG